MQLIREIHDSDVKVADKNEKVDYKVRKAARGLVFQGDTIAILYASNLQIHKLPGGGIENNESVIDGFTREILEETGCIIEDIEELGMIIEYRNMINLQQISYVFTSRVVRESRKPRFTQKEIDEGFVLKWLSVTETLHIMRNKDHPVTYAGKFIHARDLAIVEHFHELRNRG